MPFWKQQIKTVKKQGLWEVVYDEHFGYSAYWIVSRRLQKHLFNDPKYIVGISPFGLYSFMPWENSGNIA